MAQIAVLTQGYAASTVHNWAANLCTLSHITDQLPTMSLPESILATILKHGAGRDKVAEANNNLIASERVSESAISIQPSSSNPPATTHIVIGTKSGSCTQPLQQQPA